MAKFKIKNYIFMLLILSGYLSGKKLSGMAPSGDQPGDLLVERLDSDIKQVESIIKVTTVSLQKIEKSLLLVEGKSLDDASIKSINVSLKYIEKALIGLD